MIAKNILSQVDSESHHSQLLEIISQYSKDKIEVEKGKQCMMKKLGHQVHRNTTIGWKLVVNWKYGFTGVGAIETAERIKPC